MHVRGVRTSHIKSNSPVRYLSFVDVFVPGHHRGFARGAEMIVLRGAPTRILSFRGFAVPGVSRVRENAWLVLKITRRSDVLGIVFKRCVHVVGMFLFFCSQQKMGRAEASRNIRILLLRASEQAP